MNRIVKAIILLLITCHVCAQKAKLMLPIGDKGCINSVQFSPDSKVLLTSSNDNTAKLWDVATGRILVDLKGHAMWIKSAMFSPDGKKIVTASWDSTARVWDGITGKLLITLKGSTNYINLAAFSPDGKKIIMGAYDGSAQIWDANSGKRLFNLVGHEDYFRSIAFSPDGKKVVTSADENYAIIWNVQTGKLIHKLTGHTGGVVSAKFNPDGTRVITTSWDKTAKIWDVNSGKMIMELNGHTSLIASGEFSNDGKKILTAGFDNIAKIWDAYSGELLVDLKGHADNVESAEFNPEGNKVVTSSYDNTVRVWDALTGTCLNVLNDHKSAMVYACFSPDGKKIATASEDNSSKIYDVVTGNLMNDLQGHAGYIKTSIFSPDDKKILTLSSNNSTESSWDINVIKVWDAVTGRLLFNLDGHRSVIRSASFNGDGQKVLTFAADSTARIWDIKTGRILLNIKSNDGNIYYAIFSPDGKRIATMLSDTTIKIWNADDGKQLLNLGRVYYYSKICRFSPDGNSFLAFKDTNTINIWDVYSGKCVKSIVDKGLPNGKAVNFSPDGKKIVFGSYEIGKVWDLSAGKVITELKGSKYSIEEIKFSHDGKMILSVDEDGNTVKAWNTFTGKNIYDLKGNSFEFSPDGRKVVTNVGIWDAATGKLIANFKKDHEKLDSCHFSSDGKKIIATCLDYTTKIYNAENGELLYSFFAVDSSDYLVFDAFGRYDGTEAARKLLYFTCGTEIIDLDQVKDQLWVPKLAERINSGEIINAKTLDQLNICGLIPQVEEYKTNADEYFFRIYPRRGGLGETVLFVNGIEAKRFAPDQLKRKGNYYELTVKKQTLNDFFIVGKENPVMIKAYTIHNAISSRGIIVSEDKSRLSSKPPNLYAVIIGISDYKGNELDLKYASKDAMNISSTIAGAAKNMFNASDDKEHVFMYNLTTADGHYQLPEKANIKKVLKNISKTATANDILIIFFAGHGMMEGDKKQFYFITSDASSATLNSGIEEVGISTNELAEWIKPQNIKAQKRILIIDACNSGQAIEDLIKIGKNNQGYVAARNSDKSQEIKEIEKLNEKSGLFILSASASNQSAYEMDRYSQGLLTYALLKVIKQQPDILEGGKYLNISRWFNAAEKTVSDLAKENGEKQEPQIVSNTNFNIGIINDSVIAKIILADEKPLFTSSLFMNIDEVADGDDLGLTQMLNIELNRIALNAQNGITYAATTFSSAAFNLSGRYTENGDSVKVRVSLKQNSETKYRFEENDLKDQKDKLVIRIAAKALEWVLDNYKENPVK